MYLLQHNKAEEHGTNLLPENIIFSNAIDVAFEFRSMFAQCPNRFETGWIELGLKAAETPKTSAFSRRLRKIRRDHVRNRSEPSICFLFPRRAEMQEDRDRGIGGVCTGYSRRRRRREGFAIISRTLWTRCDAVFASLAVRRGPAAAARRSEYTFGKCFAHVWEIILYFFFFPLFFLFLFEERRRRAAAT